jgi:hypothetical protein
MALPMKNALPNIRAIVLAILLLLSPTAIHAASYLCVSDMATGFAYDKQHFAWRPQTLRATAKYVITRSEVNQKWIVRETGQTLSDAVCEGDITEYGTLRCEGIIEFRMNTKSLRFVTAYLFGYWSDNIPGLPDKEGDNTPSIEIGKCTAF